MKFFVGIIVQAGEVSAVWTELGESKNDVWRRMIVDGDGITHLPEDNDTLKDAHKALRDADEITEDALHQFITDIEDTEGYDIFVCDITSDLKTLITSFLD